MHIQAIAILVVSRYHPAIRSDLASYKREI